MRHKQSVYHEAGTAPIYALRSNTVKDDRAYFEQELDRHCQIRQGFISLGDGGYKKTAK